MQQVVPLVNQKQVPQRKVSFAVLQLQHGEICFWRVSSRSTCPNTKTDSTSQNIWSNRIDLPRVQYYLLPASQSDQGVKNSNHM